MTDSSSGSKAPASTPETPWSVHRANGAIKGWIERLGWLWVEGQVTQFSSKPSWKLSYITLRDPEAESSISLTCPTHLLTSLPTPLKDGDRIVVHGKPRYYEVRGSFSLSVTEIRHVGVGELLARIEALRKALAAEGLFAPERKKRLPYLPNNIGLITSRGSAAERDVISVAQGRWPHVQFTVVNSTVQGARAVTDVISAVQQLDANPEVDVIIIARGGGSVEDLLPFSEEALQRAVAACSTPIVSAIGHEPDNPILDNVADLRAATPTDAAKRVVPDAAEERAILLEARARMAGALRGWVARERQQLEALRSRPVLADPMRPITLHREELERDVTSIRRTIRTLLDQQQSLIAGLRAQVGTLGPSATLARGYSVVQVVPRDGSEPHVVTTIEHSPPGAQLRIRVSDGSITAASMSNSPAQ